MTEHSTTEHNGDLPPHPDSHVMRWSDSEARAIRAAIAQAVARETAPLREALRLSNLGHAQMFAECQKLHALVRRADQQLMQWQHKYGEFQPAWLPPAGDVQLSEDIHEAQRPDLADTSEPTYEEGYRSGFEAARVDQATAPNPGQPQQGEAIELVVTRGGKVLTDQHRGVMEFLDAATPSDECSHFVKLIDHCPQCEARAKADMAQMMQASAGQDERARFEAHIRSAWRVPAEYIDWALKWNGRTGYQDSRDGDQWSGWQARAAQPATKGGGDTFTINQAFSLLTIEQLNGMAKDAARYRHLRSTTNTFTNDAGERIDVKLQPKKWDEMIDALLTNAAKGEK